MVAKAVAKRRRKAVMLLIKLAILVACLAMFIVQV